MEKGQAGQLGQPQLQLVGIIDVGGGTADLEAVLRVEQVRGGQVARGAELVAAGFKQVVEKQAENVIGLDERILASEVLVQVD